MKKKSANYLFLLFTLTLISLFSFNVKGQSVGLATGAGYATFFDLDKNNDHSYAYYDKGSYQFLRLDLNSYIPEAKFFSFRIKLEKSTSSIVSQQFSGGYCGLSFPINPVPVINSQITLYRMSIGLMPINFSLYKNVRFKAGTELSRIFKYSFSARNTGNNDEGREVILPRDNYENVIRKYGVGFIFELQLGQYRFGKDLTIIPIYNSSIGITEDVISGYNTRSIRQSLGIAVKWDIEPKLLKQ